MTLTGVMVVNLRYFSEFDSIQSALRKMVEDIPELDRNVAQSF